MASFLRPPSMQISQRPPCVVRLQIYVVAQAETSGLWREKWVGLWRRGDKTKKIQELLAKFLDFVALSNFFVHYLRRPRALMIAR